MAGFWDEILSGKYPRAKELVEREFSRIVEQVFGAVEAESAPDAKEADSRRLEDRLRDEKNRRERLEHQVACLKAEKASLTYKLDAVRKAIAGHGDLIG